MKKHLAVNMGFLLSLIFLITILYLSHSVFDQFTIKDKDETYVINLIMKLDDLLRSLRDENSAQRRYLSSESQGRLKSYRDAVKKVNQELTGLQAMTYQKPVYQNLLAELVPLIQKRQNMLEAGIENGVRDTRVRDLINEIRERVFGMKNQAVKELRETSALQQKSLKKINFMLIMNSIVVAVLFSTVFLLLRKDIARRDCEEAELMKHRDHLDELVTRRTEDLLNANQLLNSEMEVRKQAENALHNLHERMELIREEERLAISRGIHDEIGQSLTAMKLDLAWIELKFLPGNTEFIERLNMMKSSLDRLIGKVQNIIAELRPPLLDSLGIVEAIDWQVREFQRQNGIYCHLRVDEEIRGLDDKVSTAIIRIAMEALTNVSRHAQATIVDVSLCTREDAILLEISDNGRGITAEEISSPTSYGLLGMQERARLCDGKLTFNSTPGKGTSVCLCIRLDKCGRNCDTNIGG